MQCNTNINTNTNANTNTNTTYFQSDYFMTHHHLMEKATSPNGFDQILTCLPRGWRARYGGGRWSGHGHGDHDDYGGGGRDGSDDCCLF